MMKSAPVIAIVFLLVGCIEPRTPHEPPLKGDAARMHAIYLDEAYTSILIDVRYVGDREPQEVGLEAMAQGIREMAPHRVAKVPSPRPLPTDDDPDRVWRHDDLDALFQSTTLRREPGAYVIPVFLLNGHYIANGESPTAIFHRMHAAIYYWPDDVRTYPVTVNDVGPEHPGYASLERTLLMHELGHALGLIDSGLPMTKTRLPPPDVDPCRCHSTEEESPLHYKLHSREGIQEMIEPGEHLPARFSALDRADAQRYLAQRTA